MRDLPCGPVARTRCFHWVQSLVRELRSCKLCCTAEGGKETQHKTNELAYILTKRTTERLWQERIGSPKERWNSRAIVRKENKQINFICKNMLTNNNKHSFVFKNKVELQL